ncbi:MAG: iron ABC transporter permease, partial [Actinomycetota bacterium]|nr:iron ABC transporter permease [Actinomycetota bacterium]MED6329091.1 iron ABC transporter permease [Actinomycetota bacterium]
DRVRAGRGRPQPHLVAAAVLVAAAFALPGGYVAWRVIGGTESPLALLTSSRTLSPLWRTVQLAVLVSASTAVLGTALAWITTRTDLVGRHFWRIVVPLPLVYPSFVGAAAFISGLTPGGIVHDLAADLGFDLTLRLHGLSGAWLVLTLFTYPYVYLPVAARLASLPTAFEENARLLGDRPARVFNRVVLPQIGSSIAAGSLLVFLYTVSDFGAVHLMRFETLTQTIFRTRLFDRDRSFALALLLLILALVVVSAERTIARAGVRRGALLTGDATVGDRRALTVPLGRWASPAIGLVAAVVGLALVAPAVSLADWGLFGWLRSRRGGAPLRLDWGDVLTPTWNTVWVGVATAVIAVAVVLPVAYLTTRHQSRLGGVVNAVVVAGFAIPGLVVALSLVFWTLHASPFEFLIGSMPVLVFAYVVHFGAQAVRTAQVAVDAVPRRMEDAARLLGAGRLRRLATVELPLMLPGLAAGAGLVMLSTMKELPATLLASPIGFRTLATQIWGTYEALFLPEMAILALVLLVISALMTWLLVVRRSNHLH